MLDCTFDTEDSGLWCFCPVTLDDDGHVTSIVTGMNFLSDSPPGRFIGVVHENGQEACDAWCEAHRDVIDRLIAERDAAEALA